MGLESWLKEVEVRAREGLSRPSPFGVDVDISSFLEVKEGSPRLDEAKVKEVGVDLSAKTLYMQIDQMYYRYISRIPGVEIMRIEDFAETYPEEAKEYLWKLVDPGKDKYTALAALKGRGGYFIRVKKGVKVEEPIMACLFMSIGGLQAPHNVVIVEKGAEATVYTGCTIAPEALGLHVGISEFYVEENAVLRFVMVHSWNRVSHVRPRTGVYVKQSGKYISYYVNLAKVKTLQTYPIVHLSDNAYAYLASIVLSFEDAYIDVGSAANLDGENASVEIVSRSLARDTSNIVARASITAKQGRGHIDCRGLMLSNRASIKTIPELQALTPNAILTHEASIGRLAEDEINYLISKGFEKEEAVAILLRGFVNVEIKGLPQKVKEYIETIERLTVEKSM
ncbi:MAG: SufD family Fe-S cluster assembly protein [Ignisphaera sp.]|uniref:SufD family Fe-S cluster assembly protein n=1 Tax=Ignisphaera aggregans TaxID=334771 RepID=A0A7C4JLG1_9CREN